MRFLSAVLSSVVLSCGLSGPAAAQQLWIEQGNSNARLYFGDFADNLRETTPGQLDSLRRPQARVVSLEGRDVLTMKKLRDGFDLDVRIRNGQSIVVQETNFPATDVKDGDKVVRTVWIPGARYIYDLGAQETALALDVYPTVRAGVFKVVFSGEPLPGATVKVVSASGWLREVKSDARGLVTLAFPWKGTYVLKVEHTDTRPGQRPGVDGPEKYDVAKFTTSTTFEQSVGEPPLPRPPAATPSR